MKKSFILNIVGSFVVVGLLFPAQALYAQNSNLYRAASLQIKNNHAPVISKIVSPVGSVYVGVTVTWTVSVADIDNNLSAIGVQWGDGETSSGAGVSGGSFTQSFSHTYKSAGKKTAVFAVTDVLGASVKKSVLVTVVIPQAVSLSSSLIGSLQQQLDALNLQLQELLKRAQERQ